MGYAKVYAYRRVGFQLNRIFSVSREYGKPTTSAIPVNRASLNLAFDIAVNKGSDGSRYL